MNTLLVFFAIPLAIVILSVIFETLICSPIKIAGIIFSIFLVIAFALGPTAELILITLLYTLISYVTAYITHFIITRNRCSNRFAVDYNIDNVITTEQNEVNNITSNLISNNFGSNRRCR